jgi:hypothetical protein
MPWPEICSPTSSRQAISASSRKFFLHRFLRYFRYFSEEFCRRVTKRVRAIAFNSGATVAFASNRNGWLQL